jgi:hypothetical protein
MGVAGSTIAMGTPRCPPVGEECPERAMQYRGPGSPIRYGLLMLTGRDDEAAACDCSDTR